MTTRIVRVGNTLTVEIPEKLAAWARLTPGDQVEWVTTEAGNLAMVKQQQPTTKPPAEMTLEELLGHFDERWTRHLTHELVETTHRHIEDVHHHQVWISGVGEVKIDLGTQGRGLHQHLLREDLPAVLTHWETLSLSQEQAKQLQWELAQLISRYRESSEGRQHLLRVALTPVQP